MKTQSEYTFEKDSTVWAVICWKKAETGGGYVGNKIKTFILKEDARKEVYRLNGWQDFRLDFSYNWNGKLNGKAFTSIRLWNEKKYVIGRDYDVWLSHIRKGFAKLVAVKRMKLHQINEYIARIDTGYSADECQNTIRTMYKNKRIDWNTQDLALCLFVYVDEKKEFI